MKTSITTHNCKLFNCNCKINQMHYENNMRKLEIISSFEKSLDEFFHFYNLILRSSPIISHVFDNFLKALNKEGIQISIDKIIKIELNININSDKILKVSIFNFFHSNLNFI